MFCKHCGTQLDGTPKFCPMCGGSLLQTVSAASEVQQPYKMVEPANMYVPVTPVQTQQQYQYQQGVYQGNPGASYNGVTNCSFDGNGGELLKLLIRNSFLIIFTLGIGGAWAICNIKKWLVEHTIVGGRRLTFTGKGGEFFTKYIKWFFLVLVTFGIYGFWLYRDLKAWEAEHTFYADENPQKGQVSTTSFFDGTVGEYVDISILGALLCLVTLGFYAPWLACKIYKWEMSHTVISGDRLAFNGAGLEFFAEYLRILIMTLITLGFYESWGICSLNKWAWTNTYIQSRGNQKA